jgi:hypothetical protein
VAEPTLTWAKSFARSQIGTLCEAEFWTPRRHVAVLVEVGFVSLRAGQEAHAGVAIANVLEEYHLCKKSQRSVESGPNGTCGSF